MQRTYAIYTEDTECQDCRKCVRQCPVKAIRVENGHAAIVPELCVACGGCVKTCPAGAKKVRNDLAVVKRLLAGPAPVYASLAPSWAGEFDCGAERLIRALKTLGFKAVSETALGAQAVTDTLAEALRTEGRKLLISSACPAAVDFVRKKLHNWTGAITALCSPLIAHCRLLRRRLGEGAGIVFIGPCVAKKKEADEHRDLVAAAITYEELRGWFEEAGLNPAELSAGPDDSFFPERAADGALYPVEGGMIETLKMKPGMENVDFITVSGIPQTEDTLAGFDAGALERPLFMEVLACQGGCVNGPCSAGAKTLLGGRLRVVANFRKAARRESRGGAGGLSESFDKIITPGTPVPEERIAKALRQIGKLSPADELNCDGCGYGSCRNFALAMIDGRAEPAMCVSHIRKLAQKKANALLKCIPAGVVIADRELSVIECNERFAEMFGEDAELAWSARPGLAGASLRKLLPFADLFESAFESGRELRRDFVRAGDRSLSVTVFIIEPDDVVGAVIFDETGAELRREQIAAKAREVINKNISAVQEIACLLGEHMAGTEIILRSLAEDYPERGPAGGRS
jgi:iron only hydrogenase large subunit-like protein